LDFVNIFDIFQEKSKNGLFLFDICYTHAYNIRVYIIYKYGSGERSESVPFAGKVEKPTKKAEKTKKNLDFSKKIQKNEKILKNIVPNA
jgi:hypothetical protein